MLNLDSWVHFNKDMLTGIGSYGVNQEFNSSGVLVTQFLSKIDGIGVKLLAQFLVNVWRGCYFNNFLVTPLHRAIPLKKMNNISFTIGKNLNFDVARS